MDKVFKIKSLLTIHTDTGVLAALVQAGGMVLTRVRFALVDVGLAPRSRKALRTVTTERARSVHTCTPMFTYRHPA